MGAAEAKVAGPRVRRDALRLAQAGAGARPVVGPQNVSVVLTNACNLNCITCWTYSPLRQERPLPMWTRRQLDRELLAGLFADLAELHVERVIFTGGGDPLAHREFYEIASDAKAAGLKITLISNLTLVRERSRFLALGVDTVQANFSCADAETYVAFHPNRAPADYERLLDTLRATVATGTELKLVCVVCSVNAHVLPQLLEIAAGLRASVQLKLMSATPDTRSLVLSDEQRDRLFAARPELAEQARAMSVRTNLELFFAALSGETPETFPIEQIGCHAGHFYARVDAQGAVRFCCNPRSELRVGSLQEESFAELWWSDRWQALRRQLHEGRFVPGCERCGKFDLNARIAARLAHAG
jgi:MoaA/NifB/PqqE/SkfB family radical SAM enzyme